MITKYTISMILLFILWYCLVGMAMTLMKDSLLIRQSSDLVQLLYIVVVWVLITALVIWIGEKVLKFLNKQNPNE
jgi:CBS domain containing-hemolysin-like protein